MRNGPERVSCLCKATKLRRKEESVGVVKRQVVKRWRRKGREGSERRGREGRTTPAVGRVPRGRAGMPRQLCADLTWGRPVNSEGCPRLPAVSTSSVCLEITGKGGLAFPEPALRG